MSIWTKVILVLSGAFMLSAVMASCSSGPTTVEIVQTTKAQNKLDNAAATREAALAAGENPDEVQVKIAEGSQADKINKQRAATATAQAAEGIEAVGSGSDVEQEKAVLDVEMPDGPALSPEDCVPVLWDEDTKKTVKGDTIQCVKIDIGSRGAEGTRFDPEIAKITIGSTVSWSNDRLSASSAASDEGQEESWNSGELKKELFGANRTFEHTFNTVGCFTYASLFSGDNTAGAGLGAICVVEE